MKITSVCCPFAPLPVRVLSRFCVLNLLAMLWLATSVRAAPIPQAAQQDPRFQLGYLVVTCYPGVNSDGSGDATVGIQTAINDAQAYRYAVFFPPGTYTISNTLYCAQFAFWDDVHGAANTTPNTGAATLVGSTLGAGGARPLIKLADSAPTFDNTARVKPLIAYRWWESLPPPNSAYTAVLPANAFDDPPNFDGKSPALMGGELRNIDFDCNGHIGAVGVSIPSAQYTTVENVRVSAGPAGGRAGAYAGFMGLPGAGGGSGKIEVQGGQYGIIHETYASAAPGSQAYDSGGTASDDMPIVDLRLLDQTVAAIRSGSASGSPTYAGFFIRTTTTGAAISVSSANVTASGPLCLLDGIIEVAATSATALSNAAGKSIYLRNVYVKGTNNLVQSGSQPIVTATGSSVYKRIDEYAYTDQANPPAGDPPYESGDTQFESFSVIGPGGLTDATPAIVSRTPVEPVKVINSNPGNPPADLSSRHVWASLPSFEDGAGAGQTIGVFANVVDYGATRETTNSAIDLPSDTATGPDDLAAFQAAISAAASAGHNRVFVPRGAFHFSNTLQLGANTKLFGVGRRISSLGVHDSWRPTTGSPYIIDTVDDPTATTFLGFLDIAIRTLGGGVVGGAQVYDRFSHLRWSAGENSMTIGWRADKQWQTPAAPSNPRVVCTITGSGGGRHYFFTGLDRQTGSTGYRALLISGTTKPLWIYGCNVEATKGNTVNAATNIEIINAANIRLLGMKREGDSPTLIVNNSHNVAVYGHENRNQVSAALGGSLQVVGSSHDVLITLGKMRFADATPSGGYVLREALNYRSLPVVTLAYPLALSLYKRGTLDDSAVYIAPVGGNVVINPGFEVALGTEWDANGTPGLARQSGNARSGAFALQAIASGGVFGERRQNFSVVAGQVYTISGYIRVDSVSGGGFAIQYGWYDSGGLGIGTNVNLSQDTVSTGYVLKSASLAAPAGAVTLRVKCVIKSGTNSGTAYFDDMSVVGSAAAPPDITTTSLPGCVAGETYNQTLGATGGTAPYTWSLATGALPAGLSLSSGGVISGTTTTAGNPSFTVQVMDASTLTDTQALSINVAANSVPSITTTTLPDGTVGTAYNQTLAATGGNGTLVWSLATGALPAGLALSSGGVISGTPTAGGINSFTVKVADSDGVTGAADEDTQALTLSITVGPFTSEDIGGPALAGSASLSGGVYTVTGGGTDVWSTADQFRFLHESWNGDGRIIAHVLTVQNTHANAKGGVMFREDTSGGSKNTNLVVNATAGIQLTHRATAGGITTSDALIAGFGAPYWLRLERHGSIFTGWQSPDGVVWFLTGATPALTMNTAMRVGLIANSHNAAALSTSTFDNVSVTNVPAWTAADIGSVGAAGSTSPNYSTDVITLNAAGANIYGTTDSFHFYYLAWTAGDATLIAEVTSVENTSNFAKGGVMIRKSLAANSAHATVNVTPGNGVEFLRRTTDGGTTTNTNTTGITAPRFIKLVRSSATNSFTAFQSPDGGTWTAVGTADTISMSGTVYVGLVGCSIINTTNLCTSTFESVFVK